jgi:glycosyltransferase involved in cell wall biosynthesis
MGDGANVVSEALAAGVPVITSEIPGNVGLLGRHYPVGDEHALARSLARAEIDGIFYALLEEHCEACKRLVSGRADRGGVPRVGLRRGTLGVYSTAWMRRLASS